MVCSVAETRLAKIAAYIDHDQKQLLEDLARVEMRSVSQLIAVLVKQATDQAIAEGKIKQRSQQ
jgi:uncharacterized protein (DUF1778 family)